MITFEVSMREVYYRAQYFRRHFPDMGLDECMRLARARIIGEELGLRPMHESEHVAWDGDCPAPKYLLCVYVDNAEGHCVASLGMVGVNSLGDPYLDVVVAELMCEAIERTENYPDGVP